MSAIHHTVFFWLRDDLDETRRAAFFAALRGLIDSPNVAACRVAKPADTPAREGVTDHSFDAQLAVTFDTRAAHDAYQSPADAAHTAFVEGFKDSWTKVLVYDAVEA